MGKHTVEVLWVGTHKDSTAPGRTVIRDCSSTVVLVRAGRRVIVVDPGAMGFQRRVLAGLRAAGVRPEDVDTVVNTHMHLDHTYNDHLFPNAVVYTPTSIWRSGEGNRVDIYSKTTDLKIRGIKFMSTPGHTDKHISVLVDSDRGKVVIAGDAVRESVIASGRRPLKYHDPDGYVESMKRIFSVADEIIPGHGRTIRGERLRRLRKKLDRM
jgi:N-acyl homoserine lactone hydrolase